VSKYQKEFISMDGKVFSADVYRVLRAFRVTCPAVQHAVKKLLMPGQRGTKDKKQDLNEALLSVSQAIAMADARRPEGNTLTGEPEPEPEPLPKWWRSPKLITWRKCVRIEPKEFDDDVFLTVLDWFPSGSIPEHWYPIEAQSKPVETVKQLPEGQQP
jgi:hypothetical protein